jgi:hypothetical protein
MTLMKEDRRSPQRRPCLVLRVDRSGTMRELGSQLLERIDWVEKTDELTESVLCVNCSKCARTLYSCVAEHEGELSFEPNEIITHGNHGVYLY